MNLYNNQAKIIGDNMKTYKNVETRGPIETRGFDNAEVRMVGNKENSTIVGYAAKFNTRSRNLGGFVEVIKPGAFDDVLGTLKLTVDAIGLRYEITPPNSQTVKDLVIEPLKRGDINQSSFAFRVMSDGQSWDEAEDGIYIRSITKISRLADVCPVTYPAYDDTEAATRSLNEHRNNKTDGQQGLENARAQSWRDKYLATI